MIWPLYHHFIYPFDPLVMLWSIWYDFVMLWLLWFTWPLIILWSLYYNRSLYFLHIFLNCFINVVEFLVQVLSFSTKGEMSPHMNSFLMSSHEESSCHSICLSYWISHLYLCSLLLKKNFEFRFFAESGWSFQFWVLYLRLGQFLIYPHLWDWQSE